MRGLGALLLGALIACSSHHAEPVRPTKGSGSDATAAGSGAPVAPAGGAVVTNAALARSNRGQVAAVRGTAKNAKLAAAIVNDDLVVYCLGVQDWPAAINGKQITARGKLEQTEEFSPKPSPNGEAVAGTTGAVWVLRGCSFDDPSMR
jgi:hypothetical protein